MIMLGNLSRRKSAITSLFLIIILFMSVIIISNFMFKGKVYVPKTSAETLLTSKPLTGDKTMVPDKTMARP